jgi:hypothetical protein
LAPELIWTRRREKLPVPAGNKTPVVQLVVYRVILALERDEHIKTETVINNITKDIGEIGREYVNGLNSLRLGSNSWLFEADDNALKLPGGVHKQM